jgi:hypothetical protein
MIDWRIGDVETAGVASRGSRRFIANSTQALQKPGIGTDPSSANPGY